MPNPLLYLLFFLSGAAGLVYELVWVRQLVLIFGGTTYAITTVLVAFMAGLGFGSFLAGRACRRLANPGRVYGLLEILVGLYALAVPALLGLAQPLYRSLFTVAADKPALLTACRFLICEIVLILPTLCMGATLPLLVQHITRRSHAVGRSIGLLYGINTLGAVAGVISTGFWMIPALGLTATTRLAAAVNASIGLTAILLFPRVPPVSKLAVDRPRREDRRTESQPLRALALRVIAVGFAVSGFSAMVYQIAWTRVLILSLGSSTYSFACILAAYILGLALGSLAVARWVDRWKNPAVLFGVLQIAIGLLAVFIVPLHARVPAYVQSLVAAHADDFSSLLRWEFLLIIAVTSAPTLLMGALFPLVTRALRRDADEPGAAAGRAYAVNTVGTIAGSFLGGFILIRGDVLGVQNSIALASILNALVGAAVLLASRQPGWALTPPPAIVTVAGFLLVPIASLTLGRWDKRLFTSAPFYQSHEADEDSLRRQIVYWGEGVDATIAVYKPSSDSDLLALSVNGKPDASNGSSDLSTQLLLGHLPALLAQRGSRSACVIGLGSGMTLAAVARHDNFNHLDCVEISDEVIHAASFFAPFNHDILTDDSRVRMIRADGRNFLSLAPDKYDLIVSEPSNPWLAGVSNLFTREFFETCKDRLAEDGRLAVWLHGYRMSVRNFRMVVHTLFSVFDHVCLWDMSENDYLLVASRRPLRLDLADLQRRFDAPRVREDLARIAVTRFGHVLGRFVGADAPLRDWAEAAPMHTDDNAILEFSAPRYLHQGEPQELADQLFSLHRPVWDAIPFADAPSAALQVEIGASFAARSARVRFQQAVARKDLVGAFRLLTEAFRGQPSDAELYRFILETREFIRSRLPHMAGVGDLPVLFREVDGFHPPVLAPPGKQPGPPTSRDSR